MAVDLAYVVYGLPLLFIWAAYLSRHRWRESRSIAALRAARAAGLTEPASLHPVIDPLRCIGCGSCVAACPEQPGHQVLGLIGGKAQLVSPSDCIGHGACRTACPEGAITLVFGSERRGVTIPLLSPTFETNVPGLHVAGELGGMGLIRNALTQGRQAIEAMHAARQHAPPGALDVLIVGAGPAGLAAAITAKSLGLRYLVLEQDSLGGSVFQYPRGKIVMTGPVRLPLVGRIRISTTSKEDLLGFWQEIERRLGLAIRYGQRVVTIERTESGTFRVMANGDTHEATRVLLAIGRRGTPRKLGVPGEELPKVVYRLVDPEQYAGRRVLVVGGGDSALEAATSLAEAGAAAVTLSYRGDAFDRAKAQNRARVAEVARSGRLQVRLQSQVREVTSECVTLEQAGQADEIPNDAVVVCAGGVLPNEFLRSIGVSVETHYGAAPGSP